MNFTLGDLNSSNISLPYGSILWEIAGIPSDKNNDRICITATTVSHVTHHSVSIPSHKHN